ncbi:MAG: purine-binding chemotaxis protein CheW [Alphaproteobacteria bacterium]|jgi:purine-binding chemotaxis protein CheW
MSTNKADKVNQDLNSTIASGTQGNSLGQRQFVTFTVEGRVYAVDIMSVREIRAWSDATRLPHQPSYMRGVLNLRGSIVPVQDLRNRFGMGDTMPDDNHVVVIVVIEERLLGILVDDVSDILTVNGEQIKAVPQGAVQVGEDFIEGLVNTDDGMVAILTLPLLFNEGFGDDSF